MGADATKNNPQTIFGGGNVSNNINDLNASRLLNDSNSIRNALATRNIYTPDVEYPNTNTTVANKIINSVSGLMGIIKPFDSNNLKNSVLGRAFDNTPLSQIGLVMLGKQMMYNSMSHVAQENLPVINVANLFDGKKSTKLFTKKIDLKITKKENNTLTDKFNNFVDKILFDASSSDESPFSYKSNNDDYINNTGSGQLDFLFKSLNNNLYKSDSSVLNDKGNEIKRPLESRSNLISGNRTYFNFYNNPYLSFTPSITAEINADAKMIKSYLVNTEIQEYAPNIDFIRSNFGKTRLKNKFDLFTEKRNEWVDENDEFKSNTEDNLVWGKDGISTEANNTIDVLRGDKNIVGGDNYSDQISDPTITEYNYNKYNIKSGLLEYTRNLINSTNGFIGDLTRKAHIDGEGNLGFNGSGLWKANESTYATKSNYNGKTGVRQVNSFDQYDRFTKAIRFNGNQVYGGNPNSVIYKTVMPRIHPTSLDKDNVPDSRNLMFTIENLAVGTISNGISGIIDDEKGSAIPLCEVGTNGGRIMWFPPYGIEFNETSTAKNEATVMVGRNEPMYNYQNSERTGSLSFIMLMDYPDNLRNYHNTQNTNRDINEFFAFGGDPYNYGLGVDNPEEKITILEKEIHEIEEYLPGEDPSALSAENITMVFPDNIPAIDGYLSKMVDELYLKYTYEIIRGLPCKAPHNDFKSYGLNSKIFVVNESTGVKKSGNTGNYYLDVDSLSDSFTQYTLTGDCELNKKLKDFFSNKEYRKLYNVSVYGSASTLYINNNKKEGDDFNLKLGLRRADTAVTFVKKRLEALFEESIETLGIEVSYKEGGTIGRSQSKSISSTSVCGEYNTKLERAAYILIERNKNQVEFSNKKTLTVEEQRTIKDKREEIERLQGEIIKRNKGYECMKNELTEKDGIMHGFQSVMKNKYSPVFHSQTPEDFHKRLTFLQQCVRQGAAKRYDVIEGNGQLRSKNSVFGRQPICILRLGDFLHSKIIIDNITFDYNDSMWDTNPEGFGMQYMKVKVTLQVKFIGGQAMQTPIDALQNAVSFNYYANSTFTNQGLYKAPSDVEAKQMEYMNGILASKKEKLQNVYKNIKK